MIGSKRIKVCGMREGDNILSVQALGVDMMGFIFYEKSPRYVSALPAAMPSGVSRVGVFVGAAIEQIAQRVEEFSLDYVQLHGAESPAECRAVAELGVGVIKAFSVDEAFDFTLPNSYASSCDMFVFDTKCSGHGGSGQQFDWSLLEGYCGTTPFMLSGGISLDTVDELCAFSHPALVGYDLNSRFETAAAVKDVAMLKQFLEQL